MTRPLLRRLPDGSLNLPDPGFRIDSTKTQPGPSAISKRAPRASKAPLAPVEGSLLLPEEVAARLRISLKALEHMRRRGIGPRFLRLGGRCVRYAEHDVAEFIGSIAQGDQQ